MKLRYQMRGLGIGIIVTALLMGVSKGDKLPLSDAEIKARALELGMVESDSLKLTDIPNTVPISGGASGSGETSGSEEGGGQSAGQEGETPGSGASGEENQGGSVPPEEEGSPDASGPETVNFVIESGMSSDSVCRKLAEAGLVADADAFDDYVCSQGYSQKIHAGSYEIARGTSEEDILKIITNSR